VTRMVLHAICLAQSHSLLIVKCDDADILDVEMYWDVWIHGL